MSEKIGNFKVNILQGIWRELINMQLVDYWLIVKRKKGILKDLFVSLDCFWGKLG